MKDFNQGLYFFNKYESVLERFDLNSNSNVKKLLYWIFYLYLKQVFISSNPGKLFNLIEESCLLISTILVVNKKYFEEINSEKIKEILTFFSLKCDDYTNSIMNMFNEFISVEISKLECKTVIDIFFKGNQNNKINNYDSVVNTTKSNEFINAEIQFNIFQ